MDRALARVIVGPTPGGKPAAQSRADRILSVVAPPRETATGTAEAAPPEAADLADTQELPLALVMPLPVNRETAADAGTTATATNGAANGVAAPDADADADEEAADAEGSTPTSGAASSTARGAREPGSEELA
ncbi:MAG: hypothetical protein ACRDSS_11840, partial [Actinocrinis sp.]